MPRAPDPPIGRLRGADPRLWRELRLEAVRRDVAMGVLFNEILREWLERRGVKMPPPKEGNTAA
jgi:hypothetical protein